MGSLYKICAKVTALDFESNADVFLHPAATPGRYGGGKSNVVREVPA